MTATPTPRATTTTTTQPVPMTVLFDPKCPLCRWLREWVADKRQLVPLTFVAAGSEEARRRFPTLDPQVTVRELHVVDDGGAVYMGESAYIAVLWALEDYRELSYRISTGILRGVAKRAMALLSKYRPRDVHGLASCDEACDACGGGGGDGGGGGGAAAAAGGRARGTRAFACDLVDDGRGSWGSE